MLHKLTRISFFLLIFSLIFMQPFIYVAGFRAIAADIIFLATFSLWLLSLLTNQARFRWHKFFWLLIFYFAAMLISAVFSVNPRTSFVKLAGEIYLLCLPVLTYNLIETEQDLKLTLKIWLFGSTFFLILAGVLTFFLFYFDRTNSLLGYTLFSYGSLPPGNYPRFQLSFVNANMLCNYLSVSVMMLLIFQKLGWINQKLFVFLLAGTLFCAIFTVSPSLGGIALSAGIWYWIYFRNSKLLIALVNLFSGVVLSAVFLIALSIAPYLHPTAPFFIEIPLIGKTIAPSVRVMNWMDSWKTFAENPFFGRGLGQDVCQTKYLDSGGLMQTLTDAHNVFLNVAAQEGVFGLAAIILLIFYLSRKTFPLKFNGDRQNIFRVGFGLAFISAFVYQGIGGSYEDARHLWLLIGLVLAVEKLSVTSGAE